ncbi:hypothetical protein EEL30_06700 [Brevibacillus laterosporus]|uniref:Uncharacterized protein n=1 Tax=Brevibacillus laterosporus TaxID=1465 RepID=A0A518V531_BRELA|nr:hypothetical protein EEL30_06700 [Brevibacillus laterosporus]
MQNTLDKLKIDNEFPIIFIGSGISKRFLLNYPDWTSLLESFWLEMGLQNFYGELNNLRDSIEKENPSYNVKEIDFYTNIKMGTLIEEKYNKAFNEGKISIADFTPKDAYKTKIQPLKKAIASKFSEYQLKDTMLEEYRFFQKMLLKAQIILTTNYDSFVEQSYNEISQYKIDKYIGQKGFFKQTLGYAELYKLHGSVDCPSDIIISENDYNNFEKNSVLISAKIISMMIHSPIIFIGYSLTDLNIRKIIKDFTRSLTEEEIILLEDRLILIEWLKDEKNIIEEAINDKDLGCKIKLIKTDNFEKIFKTIGAIDQGVAPSGIRKYQHILKKLIVDRGREGELNTVLTSTSDLDSLEDTLKDKKIAVALGDSTYIYQSPDIISYSLDYISESDMMSLDIKMKFAATQNPRSRIPICKLLDSKLMEKSNLHPSDKEKLKQKIGIVDNFDIQFNKINKSNVINRNAKTVKKIIQSDKKKEKIYATLSYNIKQLDLEEIKDFIISELKELKSDGANTILTELRRLMLLYDILKNTKGATPNH